MKNPCLPVLVYLSLAGALGAAPFAPGDIAVYRVGDVSSALSNAAAPVVIDEYTPSGIFVQSIAVPSTNTSTNNNTLTGTGNSTSEGELTLSTNGQFLVFGGYGADTGTANVSSATAAAPRVVGRLDVTTDALDTSTRLNSTTYAGDNFRGVASQDGSAFWLAGNGSNNRGTRFAMLGGTSSSSIQSSQNNTRAVGIYNGQLYTTTSAGVYTVGTGVPTTNNQTTTLLPPGTEFSSSLAYTGFYLTPDGTHLFVATGAAANYI